MMSSMARKTVLAGGRPNNDRYGELLTIISLIVDDHYEHALRLFKDRDSGGIRIQASVRSGELKRYSAERFSERTRTHASQNARVDCFHNPSDCFAHVDVEGLPQS